MAGQAHFGGWGSPIFVARKIKKKGWGAEETLLHRALGRNSQKPAMGTGYYFKHLQQRPIRNIM